MKHASTFFAYARERQNILLRRRAGLPREEWTRDPILQRYRFTCVRREDDRTTIWFREHVRDPMRDRPEVLLATVVFRMLNRVEVGEAMFCQPDLGGRTGFDLFYRTEMASELKRNILALVGKRGPFVTGAYIISSPQGKSKLDGVMSVLQNFHRKSGWRDVAECMMQKTPYSLQEAHVWFRAQPWMGSFHSYEIVSDLRWTSLLDRAPDIMTWAHAGPGARRGLNRIAGRDKRDKSLSQDELVGEMRELLAMSGDEKNWPQKNKRDWPALEMRDIEHLSCEVDKMMRVQNGEGRPRGVYR